MPKRRALHPMFSQAPVAFRQSAIEGRGVFARRHFVPGEYVVPYAPKQRRIPREEPEAVRAAATKLTLLSEGRFVIIPDTSVPGGWLCNHSCDPNAAIFSDGEGRVECTRPIAAGEEVTIFYGWVTGNERERDLCRCGSGRCRGFINFDISDEEAFHAELDTAPGRAFRRRLEDYVAYLRAISQEQVEGFLLDKLERMQARTEMTSANQAAEP